MEASKAAYDLVAYPGYAFPQTHPDQLAAMTLLHGLTPAPVEKCRVLEIACNQGANLIPMAYALPQSEFTGFDLAGLPVARGQERIRQLGLRNVRLYQADVLEAGSGLGEFDYIIAHGLYAWVPDAVRDALFTLCREHLAPNGVAFVSYNALPGAHIKTMMGQMMRYQVRNVADLEQRIPEAVAFVKLLVAGRPEDDPYRPMLQDQLKRLERRDAHAVFHDEFDPQHRPLHFFEFAEHAARHGLQYLSEASLPPPTDPCYRQDLQERLQNEAPDDPIAREQLLDFLRLRMFRETLLCRRELEVNRDMPVGQFRRLRFSSQTVSSPGESAGGRKFTLAGGISMETSHPGVIEVMEQLIAAWPHTLSFDQIGPTLAGHGILLESGGAPTLLRLAISRMIELHAWSPPVSAGISERPRATATSRDEAARQSLATTLLHATLQLEDPVARRFLQLLDGTRDRAALVREMRASFPDLPAEQLAGGMEEQLQLLYRAAILEA